jgi:hypothetical protein
MKEQQQLANRVVNGNPKRYNNQLGISRAQSVVFGLLPGIPSF